MSMELDRMEVKQVVIGEGIEAPLDLASDSTDDAYKHFVKEEPTAPSLAPSYQHDSLQCFQCFITFCNYKAKERHMKKSHREEYKQQLQQSDMLFTCYVCDRAFQSSLELTEHQAVHSKEDKPFKCPHCQESFRTFSEVTSHRRHVCPEKPYPCRDCGKSFRGVHLLRGHRAACHAEWLPDRVDAESKTHRCAKCGRGFEEEAELLQHQENHAADRYCNGGAPAQKRRGRPPQQAEPANGEKRERPGSQTEEAAKTKGRRGRPPKPAPGADDLQGLECAGPAPLPAPKKGLHGRPPPPPGKLHACAGCEESFSRPEQLEAHSARAHSTGRHTCPACGKSFGRENSLRAHQLTHAGPEGPADGHCGPSAGGGRSQSRMGS